MWDRPRNLFHQYPQSSVASTVKLGEVRLLPRGLSPQDLGSSREGRDKHGFASWDLVISLSDSAWRLLWVTLSVNLTNFRIN